MLNAMSGLCEDWCESAIDSDDLGSVVTMGQVERRGLCRKFLHMADCQMAQQGAICRGQVHVVWEDEICLPLKASGLLCEPCPVQMSERVMTCRNSWHAFICSRC